MPRCPACGKEITHLIYARSIVEWIPFQVWDGKKVYGDPYPLENDAISQFECPECLKTVAKTEEEALKFLGGKPDMVTYLS